MYTKYYTLSSLVKNIMVHPSNNVSKAAAFTHNVEVMRVQELKRFLAAVRDFYKSFETQDFRDLSPIHIQKLIGAHNLSIHSILSNYTKITKDAR